MFHRSTFGPLGELLPCDLDGNVPQEGDRPEHFNWDPRTEWTAQSWSAFVDGAVRATAEAQDDLRHGGAASALLGAAAGIASQARGRRHDSDALLLAGLRDVARRLEPLVATARERRRKTGRLIVETDRLEDSFDRITTYVAMLAAQLQDPD